MNQYEVFVCPICKKQTVDDGMGTLEQDCQCDLRGRGVFPWERIEVVPKLKTADARLKTAIVDTALGPVEVVSEEGMPG